MPDSYHAGHGYSEPCTHCDYSYGRWFDPCDEFFVRNGCCVCTPYCPPGMIMSYWAWPKPSAKQNALKADKDSEGTDSKEQQTKKIDDQLSGYVCLIH